jgi:hypothetical protein
MKRLKTIAVNLAISSCTLMLCLLMAEMITRLFVKPTINIVYDEELLWTLQPNADFYDKIGFHHSHTNSLGLRNTIEPAEMKQPNQRRLLFLGDSRTFGYGVSDTANFINCLVEFSSADSGAFKIQPINGGVNAYSFYQMWLQLKRLEPVYHPDGVILGPYNSWHRYDPAMVSPAAMARMKTLTRIKSVLRRSRLYTFIVENQFRTWYDENKAKFVMVDRFEGFEKQRINKSDSAGQSEITTHELFLTDLDSISAYCKKRGLPALIWVSPQYNFANHHFEQSDATARFIQHARKLGMPVFDLHQTFAAKHLDGKAYYQDRDDTHLSPEGQKLLAENLYPLLRDTMLKNGGACRLYSSTQHFRQQLPQPPIRAAREVRPIPVGEKQRHL